MVKRKVKYYLKDVVGASLMEIIFVLGIMAVLAPVVIKFAFKDLADVRYLNLAKQLKELVKALTAYTSSERDNWTGASGEVKLTDLSKYGLETVVDENLLNNLSLKYVKGDDDSIVLYGVVDMTPFKLDAISFNKTLLYAENNIGYVVTGEKCGDCSSSYCACSINGNWGVNYSEVAKDGSSPSDGKRLAVVRIDDSLLEKEFESSIYLYRNKSGAGLNEMGRDLFLGDDGKPVAQLHDVKNVKDLNVRTVAGLAQTTEGSTSVNYLPLMKAKKGSVAGEIEVKGSIYFKQVADHSWNFTSAKLLVPEIIFKEVTVLGNFVADNALLLVLSLGNYKPQIKVAGLTSFNQIDLQNLEFTNLISDDMNKLNIYGLEHPEGSMNFVEEKTSKSRFKVEAPNIEVQNMNAKILNINSNYVSAGKFDLKSGKIRHTVNSAPTITVYDIKGTSGKQIWSLLSSFDNGNTNIRTKINEYKSSY